MAVSHMPSGKSGSPYSHRKKYSKQHSKQLQEAAVPVLLLPVVAARMDKPVASVTPYGMTRRLIEVHHEARLLRRQPCDSYDL
jgi:hypothetical protein